MPSSPNLPQLLFPNPICEILVFLFSSAHFRVNGWQIVHLVMKQGILIRKEVILHSIC